MFLFIRNNSRTTWISREHKTHSCGYSPCTLRAEHELGTVGASGRMRYFTSQSSESSKHKQVVEQGKEYQLATSKTCHVYITLCSIGHLKRSLLYERDNIQYRRQVFCMLTWHATVATTRERNATKLSQLQPAQRNSVRYSELIRLP